MKWNHRIGRRLKLRELNVLLAVAQAGSMAKAGRDLAISQSAISRAIADMEHTLGVPLFDRTSQGIELTQYGRAILNRAVAVFDELNQGVQDIEFLADPTGGELWIGSAPGLAEGIVLAVIDRISRRFPRIAIHVVPAGLFDLSDKLRERKIELAFAGSAQFHSQQDIEAEFLYEEPLVVIASNENPWSRRRKIKLAELINEPWTWTETGTAVDKLIGDAFRASGLEPPRATVNAEAYSLRVRLAATGRFLAIVPASIMKFPGAPTSIKVLPVDLPTTRRQIGIITLKDKTRSPLGRLFIEEAREISISMTGNERPRVSNPRGKDSAARHILRPERNA
jgi:DNA-binding transcriptional LysR family regulator